MLGALGSDTPDGLRFRVGDRLEFELFQLRPDAFYVPGPVVVIDGKEVLRRPIGTNQTLLRGAGIAIQFTPNSKHWFFHYNNPNESDPRADPPRLV